MSDTTWPEWLLPLIAEHRRRHTFGGELWFPDEPEPLTGEELLDEVEWLLGGGVHPLMVCQVLGKHAHAIEQAATRGGRRKVARLFAPKAFTRNDGRKAS